MFVRSSFYKANSPQCVMVARHPEGVQVRDSKHQGGPVLWFHPHEWAAFVAGVKAGEFDLAPEPEDVLAAL